jgi:hypothetical protein
MKTEWHPIRVPAETWLWLVEVARRESLTHGGQPSPSKAITWLADQDRERASCARRTNGNSNPVGS